MNMWRDENVPEETPEAKKSAQEKVIAVVVLLISSLNYLYPNYLRDI